MGQLGDNTILNKNTPTQVGTGTAGNAISFGSGGTGGAGGISTNGGAAGAAAQVQ